MLFSVWYAFGGFDRERVPRVIGKNGTRFAGQLDTLKTSACRCLNFIFKKFLGGCAYYFPGHFFFSAIGRGDETLINFKPLNGPYPI